MDALTAAIAPGRVAQPASDPRFGRRPLLSLAVALVVLASCGGGGAGTDGDHPAGSDPDTLAALCRLVDDLAGDRDAAGAAFYDRAHDELHAIAEEVQEMDRAAAARLLVAKERVEEALLSREIPTGFGDDARELLAATRAALEALGRPAPAC